MTQRRNIYGIPDGLWREAKSAAARKGVTVSAWLRDAIHEKLEGDGEVLRPYILIRRDGTVEDRLPFDADPLDAAGACDIARRNGYACVESRVEIFPGESEAQGPAAPVRAVIDVDKHEKIHGLMYVLEGSNFTADAVGIEDPADVAEEWLQFGFTPPKVAKWLQARCFTASAVDSLEKTGITPEEAKIQTTNNGVRDTIGYLVANADLSDEEALEIVQANR